MSELIKDLDITALVHGGRGLGRVDGKAVFVPQTMPGDRVTCRVVKSKKSFIEADLCDLQVPSPRRREPLCPLFGDCGGCQWQHLPYPEQTAWKQQIFADLMTRREVADPAALLPIRQAPDEWHYRNRVQFKCRMTDNGFVIGFYRAGSHFVVDAEACPLLCPPIADCLTVLRAELPAAPAADKVPQVDVSCSDDGSLQLIVHVLPDAVAVMTPWLAELGRVRSWHLSLQSGRKGSIRQLHTGSCQTIKVGDPELLLQVSPGGFAQVNAVQNRALVAAVMQHANLQGQESVLDLFCGVGNFALPLARQAGEILGIENYAPAISDARRNAEVNAIHNASFVAEPAEGASLRHWSDKPIDLVVIDPPRSGSYSVIRDLLARLPGKIIYVSCDPATLVRDLTPLVHQGYRVTSAQAFDLFPQTWHIESVTCLERTS